MSEEVRVHKKTEITFRVSVQVAATNTLLGWLSMFEDKMKIVRLNIIKLKILELISIVTDLYHIEISDTNNMGKEVKHE